MRTARSGVSYAGPSCPRCGATLEVERLAAGAGRCTRCGGGFEATRFEPPQTSTSVSRRAEAGPAGATACANHPGNAAAAHCNRCGILMCALCRIQTDGMALCPPCFERLSEEGALPSTRVSFRDYSRMAWTLALLGIPMFYFGGVTGPASVYYAVRGVRQKRAMGDPAAAWGVVFVLLVAIAQVAACVWFFATVFGETAGGAGQ